MTPEFVSLGDRVHARHRDAVDDWIGRAKQIPRGDRDPLELWSALMDDMKREVVDVMEATGEPLGWYWAGMLAVAILRAADTQ